MLAYLHKEKCLSPTDVIEPPPFLITTSCLCLLAQPDQGLYLDQCFTDELFFHISDKCSWPLVLAFFSPGNISETVSAKLKIAYQKRNQTFHVVNLLYENNKQET